MQTKQPALFEQQDNKTIQQLAKFISQGIPPDNLATATQNALLNGVEALFLSQLNKQHIQLEDTGLLDQLTTFVQHNNFIFLSQEWAMREVNRTLTEAGIRCVWFKGASLSNTNYDQPNMRTKSDLDCIVYQADVERSLELLLAMDYEIEEDRLKISTIAHDKLSHHIQLRHKKQSALLLELHRHLLGLSGPKFLPQSHLKKWLDEAITFKLGNQSALTFRPEYHLLYICAHVFLQHGEEHIKLRHFLDMHLLITQHDFDWAVLVDEAVALKWTFLLEYSLRRVVAYFDTPVDTAIFEQLQSRRPADESTNQVLLNNQFVHGETVFEFMGQLSKREQLISIWQIAFPPSSYMRERYRISPHAPVMPYYLYRAGSQIIRLLTSALRRLTVRVQ